MYFKLSPTEALEQILQVLGNPDFECSEHPTCMGCDYERKETIYIARAALGQPVPRQKCLECGALDQIWADNKGPMICHSCKAEEPKYEFIEAVV